MESSSVLALTTGMLARYSIQHASPSLRPFSPPAVRQRLLQPLRSLRSYSQAAAAASGAGNKACPKTTTTTKPAGAAIEAPRRYGPRYEGDFTPQPLPRPIGMPQRPRAGENTGIDDRTLSQRRHDLFDRDRNMVRRKELTEQFSRPYFRDWSNLQFHDGKSFLAPPRLFRAEASLYFPNLQGRTLAPKDKTARDTTPLLTGRASVVSVFSSRWAEVQVGSFVSSEANPALHDVVSRSPGGRAQLVHVNYEDNAAKAWLLWLFRGSLRRRFAQADWDKYFLVRRGISDDMREAVGLLNAKVGYVFLVDHHCRIRWAGSGDSRPDERESLVKGLAKLANEVDKEKE
ncbi:hypothetical protein L249_3477 [Ophiocordyceps polyrhachis-furcata BCC 54312]|uniref:Uncharacterized protein n=1 Tax=Ophiocordyceps polyrhachis-furcata BCC 54312 TaxID=1330021 RepID=A0A367LMU2_9HYPO|nr:hypothetical protein L249_3477 [Ophiocordyceps polyrhachis-furcata BCC 54312]